MTTPSSQRDVPFDRASTPIDPMAAGAIIADRYRVVKLLGEGGMGAVYRVEHVHMRKAFALKVLRGEFVRSPEAVARFEREAVAAAAIEHPNVAAATDFGRLPDGTFFLVLELVDGRSLRTELANGPLSPARAFGIMRGIVGAVGAAHAKGIVHRDLKPENVMLVHRDGDDDFVKVLDFGIAKVAEAETPTSADASQPITRVGVVMGTPNYMSPEQALGQPVDARSDLYSLGIVFYELLSGGCPFTGGAVTVTRHHLVDPPPPLAPELLATLPPGTSEIIAKLLAKDPAARFQSALELWAALDEAGSRAAIEAAPALVIEPPRANARRRIAVWAGVAGLLVAVVAAVGAFSSRDSKPAVESHAKPAAATSVAVSSTASAPASAIPPLTASASAAPAAASAGSTATASASASASATSRPAASAAAKAPASRPRTRKTGPGGIYIPPPRDWFK